MPDPLHWWYWPGELAGPAVPGVDIIGQCLIVSDGQQLQPPAHLAAPAADAWKYFKNMQHICIHNLKSSAVRVSICQHWRN